MNEFSGPGDLLDCDTQEEHAWNFIRRRSDDDDGASCGSNLTRTRHSSSSNCFTSSYVRGSTCSRQPDHSPSSGRPSKHHRREEPGSFEEFSGRREDFQQWARTTEAFFAGVIKESEMTMEITMTPIDLEFSPTDSNVDRGVQNLEFVVQQMHTALMALTSFEANDIVANSRKQKNPLEAWRRLHERQNRAEMSSEKESERLQKESWREKPGGKYARTESLRESESGR